MSDEETNTPINELVKRELELPVDKRMRTLLHLRTVLNITTSMIPKRLVDELAKLSTVFCDIKSSELDTEMHATLVIHLYDILKEEFVDLSHLPLERTAIRNYELPPRNLMFVVSFSSEFAMLCNDCVNSLAITKPYPITDVNVYNPIEINELPILIIDVFKDDDDPTKIIFHSNFLRKGFKRENFIDARDDSLKSWVKMMSSQTEESINDWKSKNL